MRNLSEARMRRSLDFDVVVARALASMPPKQMTLEVAEVAADLLAISGRKPHVKALFQSNVGKSLRRLEGSGRAKREMGPDVGFVFSFWTSVMHEKSSDPPKVVNPSIELANA